MLADEQIAEMERLADAATSGPWRQDYEHVIGEAQSVAVCQHIYVRGAPAFGQNFANAAHIASCSPDRIKALIAEVRRLRAEVERLRRADEMDHRGVLVNKLIAESERRLVQRDAALAEVRRMRPVVEAARLARLALHIDDAERATVLLDHVGSLIDKVGAQ